MQPATHPQPQHGALLAYFALLYGAVFWLMTQFWTLTRADAFTVKVFLWAATAAYAGLFLLLPVLLTWLAARLLRRRKATRFVTLVAYLSGTAVLMVLYADYRIHMLYDYHFNGFVWNLLTTPGGIAALGATESTQWTAALQVGLILTGSALCLFGLKRMFRFSWAMSRRWSAALAGLFLLVFVSQEGVYAYSTFTGQEDYIEAAQAIPFHLRSSFTTLMKRLGIKRTARSALRIAGGTVDYPGHALQAAPLKKYPNILMLVAESFRWDLLDPEITPHLWALAQRSAHFKNHYSGGNRTRMGLFSMFYGIYAPYWYSFERQRIAPVLMNFLREKDYQLALHTSQSFNYPELRHTLFAGIPENFLQELNTGAPWKRDRQNIGDLIGKLDKRDRQRPFYGFMFFESTHAPYDFPEDEPMVRLDYQRDLNYMKMDLKDNIDAIHARYINAAHHIDREVGRLLDHLKKSGMLEDTIVMFTGDHGEEFMEKGHWGHGHGSTFPEEQLRVPLVLHLPGRKPQTVTQRTSHLQLSPTLLAQLGVEGDSHAFSSAGTLFDPTPDYFVAGEYDYMAIYDDQYKITFPYTGSSYFHYTVTHANDHPVSREVKQQVIERYQARIDAVVKESQRFVR